MPNPWALQANVTNSAAAFLRNEEFLNKYAGEKKGNYNFRKEEKCMIGAGGTASFSRSTSLFFYYLFPLCRPSTSTQNTTTECLSCSCTARRHTVLWESIVKSGHNWSLSYTLIRPAQVTCIKNEKKQKKQQQQNLNHQPRFYLPSGTSLWQSSSSSAVSPPAGYQMCLAQVGMRHTQINILPQGATVESQHWTC